MSSLIKLLKLIIKEPLFILLSVILGFLTIESSVGLMALSALLISEAALHFTVADLSLLIVGVRFLGISRAALRYAERCVSHSATFRILRRLRVWFYNRLEPLVPQKTAAFHSGDLFSRMVNDVESLKEFFLRVVNPPVVAMAVMCFTTAMLAFISKPLAFQFAACFIISGFTVPVITGFIGRKSGERVVSLKSGINTHLLDCFSGISEIMTFNMSQVWNSKLESLSREFMALRRKLAFLNGFSSAIHYLASSISMWLALLICIPLVSSGKLRGDFLAMIFIGILSCFEAIQVMGPFFHRLEESCHAARRLFDITGTGESFNPEATLNDGVNDYGITVHSLHMSYGSDRKPAIRDVSLELTHGKKTAVVGPNGSGKSSLIQVLTGSIPYDGGEVKIGGIDLRKLNREYLMDAFAIVPQNPYIFNSTILENLRIADLEASETQITEALSLAQLWDFVASLPKGLDSQIGEGGFKLSGGQRQRLAIARAFLRDRPVMILDEPFTGLDPGTEEALFLSLQKYWANKSVILVTHDLNHMDLMDEILVMDKGSIVEHGTHDSLIKSNGLYCRMRHQQQAYRSL